MKKDLRNYDFITVREFLEEYVFPYLGKSLNVDERIALNSMSHLDLDELNIPGVVRIGDEDSLHFSEADVILVGAKGYKHKGYEVHGYLRPFNVLKDVLKSLGYTEEDIMNILITKSCDFDFSDEEFVDRNNIRKRVKYNG